MISTLLERLYVPSTWYSWYQVQGTSTVDTALSHSASIR